MEQLDLSIVIKSCLASLPWRGVLVFLGVILLGWIALKLWGFFRDVGR